MRSSDLRGAVAHAIRSSIVAIGLVALSAPAAVILSSNDAYARGDGGKGDGKGGKGDGGGLGAAGSNASGGVAGKSSAGTKSGRGANTSANGKGRAGAKAGAANLGIFGGLFSGSGTASGSTSGGTGFTAGQGAFGMETSGVRESFESLTKAQQARVMQRCKDVIASPAQADPNQLALCQTLAAMAKR
jgi:hypothetical protein